MNIMDSRESSMIPSLSRILSEVGGNIKLARLRRKLSARLVAERAGITRTTLWAVEKGAPSVSMGIYARVLMAVGLEKDLLLVAKDDLLGRKLQDLGLVTRRRSPKRSRNG
jgi:transcriptional regulator with XRE-family HTH domain